MQRVSTSVVAAIHEMFLISAKSGVPVGKEVIARTLRRMIAGRFGGQSKYAERKRRELERLVEGVHRVCGEAARLGRFECSDEVARRAGVEIKVSRSASRQQQTENRRCPDGFDTRHTQQHELLRKETESADCRRLLKEMQADCDIFRQFASWTEVTAHMEDGKIRRPETDAVLIPIFERMEWDKSPHWQMILLVLFWNFLKEEHRFKRNWCPEDEDRWQNVVLAFLQSAKNVDLTRRRVGLAQKLANDTVHHLYAFCREFATRPWHQNAVQCCDPKILEEVAARKSLRVEARDLSESLVRRVLEMAEQGVISEWAADVLIATRLEGRRLKDLPGKGCSYETAKKRRQREETKLLRAFPTWERVMSIA